MTVLLVLFSSCRTSDSYTVNQTTIVNDATVAVVQEQQGDIFDVNKIVGKMKEKNRPFLCGLSSDVGVWVVCRADVHSDGDMPQEQMLSLAEMRAKRDIASWMNTAVSSEASLERSQTLQDDGTVSVSQAYHSLTKTSSEALLKGVTLHSFASGEEGINAFFYATGYNADMTSALEAQLREAPPGVVRAVGFGVIADREIASAKRQAVQAALRNAVEQVMGATVVGQSQLMDNEKAKSKLLSQTVGNVKEYRIVKEGEQGVSYQVILNARVDENDLLDNYAAFVRSMGNPGFYISCADEDLDTTLNDFFAGLGFYVIEDENEAQFEVEAECKYIEVLDNYYGEGIQIETHLTLSDRKSGQRLISMRNRPVLTSTYSGAFHQRRQVAAGKAFKSMREELHEKLNQVVMDWVLNGREVKVVFKSVPDGVEKLIPEIINGVPCATYHTLERNDSDLTVFCSYVGPTADLDYFLSDRLHKDLPPEISSPKTERVELNLLELVFQIN
ncbi:MAG: hypothetical protein MJ202_06530 [Lentisphaeria bacterium]|nr:hypothetical protein [Lentisphaeria bacterium]